MSAVRFDNETLCYGDTPVLRDVNLTLHLGERVAILGKSGAGKTTLLSAIYQKFVISNQRVALVPQDLSLVPQLSVTKNTMMGRLDDHGALRNFMNLLRTRSADRAEILSILKQVEMSPHADRAVEALSGGQKQRTALARAFFRDGEVLLGDEPFSALDEKQGETLLKLATDRFATLIFVLHDVKQAYDFATRIIGIESGRIAYDGPAQSLALEDAYALYRQ